MAKKRFPKDSRSCLLSSVSGETEGNPGRPSMVPRARYITHMQTLWSVFPLDAKLLGSVCAKSFQSCLILCNPMDCSLPGSSVHGISQQEYWSGLPFPPPGDLPHPGIEPVSLMSPALAGRFFTTSTTWEAHTLSK